MPISEIYRPWTTMIVHYIDLQLRAVPMPIHVELPNTRKTLMAKLAAAMAGCTHSTCNYNYLTMAKMEDLLLRSLHLQRS